MKLEKEKLTELVNNLKNIQNTSTEIFTQLQISLVDIGNKIEVDNCGTTTPKNTLFATCLDDLVVISDLPEYADSLIKVLDKN